MARGRRVDVLQHRPVLVLDREAHVGTHDRAAVGQRRVGDGELERGDLDVALADGEVDVVADRPRAAVGDPAAGVLGLALERAGGVLALELELVAVRPPGRRRQRSGQLAGKVDPGRPDRSRTSAPRSAADRPGAG